MKWPIPRARRAAVLACVAVVLATAGCGSSRGKYATESATAAPVPSASASAPSAPTPSGSTTATGESSSRAAQAAQDALAAYRAAYADWVAVAATSNYQDPRLADHLSGQALSYVTRSIYINKTKGAVAKGQPALKPTLGQMLPATDPTEVVINSAADDSNWLLYTTDGHLFNDVPGGCHQSQALVVKNDGVWKVDQFAINKPGTC